MDRPAALNELEVLSHVHTASLKNAPQHDNLYHDIIKGSVNYSNGDENEWKRIATDYLSDY